MAEICKTAILYRFFLAYLKSPRIRVSKLHRDHSPYKVRNSTINLLKQGKENSVLIGPFLYCNSGIEVELIKKLKDPFYLMLQLRNDPSITKIVMMMGEYSLLVFRRGANMLKFAAATNPCFPSDHRIQHMNPRRCGKLPCDLYPEKWDHLDWDIYNEMIDPNVSFPKISSKFKDVSWRTIRDRYNRIVNDCKVWMEFFPSGKKSYSQVFFTFKTDYEIGVKEELEKINRTSYLYKVGETLLLTLFLDNNMQQYAFLKLQKRGLIRDLTVSIPLRYWEKISPAGPHQSHPRHRVDELLRGVQKARL
ncbi:MAG: hypothetical protein WBA22_10625 [Candidatus Methanofastidiosia archaeon]